MACCPMLCQSTDYLHLLDTDKLSSIKPWRQTHTGVLDNADNLVWQKGHVAS